jgi:NitT/TauT family transport system substrate-binding protein
MAAATIRILMARHSAFYTPVIAAVAAGFLRNEGLDASYGVLPKGQRARDLIRAGQVDVVQSAVSSNWGPMEKGETDLPVHFVLINRRDGFFLSARAPAASFDWKQLEGATVLADHGGQPLAMLQYAAHRMGVDWSRVKLLNRGSPEEMDAAFRAGEADYIHQQGPAPQQLERDGAGYIVASVGEAIPPVAFSTLMASREFLATERARAFLRGYRKAREWVVRTDAGAIAHLQSKFFAGTAPVVLAAAIARYQVLGCWAGDIAITRELYEASLNVFLHSGAITRRHEYEQVVVSHKYGSIEL